MSTNDKISEDQLKDVLSKNPEFAKKLMVQNQLKEASATPVKRFNSYDEAKATINFLEPISEEVDSSNLVTKKFGTGIIKGTTQYLPYLTGKYEISFPLSLALAKPANGRAEFEYSEEFEIVRILLAKRIDNDIETVYHVDVNNLVHVGKHYLYKFDATHYIKDFTKTDDDKYEIYINASPEDKYIKIDAAISDSLVNAKETFYIVPIVVSKNKKAEILTNIDEAWDAKKSDFLAKLTSGYEKCDADKIVDAFEKVSVNKKVLLGNLSFDAGFSKGMALYYLDRNEVSPIQDGITENSKDADYLNIVSNLYPKYGEEWIDINNGIKLDEHGMPELSKNNLKCLKIVGVTEELAKNIYSSGVQSLDIANSSIEKTKIDNNKISEIANAECRLIVDLDGDNWVSSLDFVYDTDVNETDYRLMFERSVNDSNVDDAQRTIYEIKQQFAVLQKTAKRIEAKINSGEFSNVYMVLCNEYFYSLYKNTIKHDEDSKNISVFPMLIQLFTDDYNNNNEFLSEKIEDTLYNTIHCNTHRDKYGNPVDNLFDKFASIIDDFVDLDAVPDNLSEDERLKALMDQVFVRFKYLDGLAKTPYKFVIKLCPELAKAFAASKLPEDANEKSDKYAKELGFNVARVNFDDVLEKYKDFNTEAIKNIREKIGSIKKEYLNYLKVLNNNKSKNRMDKARTFAKFAIYFTMYAYVESISTGLSPIDKSLSDEELNREVYLIKDASTDKEISKEDYISLDAEKRKSYTIFKKLSTEEVDSVISDWYLRTLFLSAFIILFSRLIGKYKDNLLKENSNKDLNADANKMLVSEIGLCVPSIAVLEYPNFTNGSDKKEVDFSEIIPIESKIKLGTTAVNNVLKDLNNSGNLIKARSEYLKCSAEYSEKLLNILFRFNLI